MSIPSYPWGEGPSRGLLRECENSRRFVGSTRAQPPDCRCRAISQYPQLPYQWGAGPRVWPSWDTRGDVLIRWFHPSAGWLRGDCTQHCTRVPQYWYWYLDTQWSLVMPFPCQEHLLVFFNKWLLKQVVSYLHWNQWRSLHTSFPIKWRLLQILFIHTVSMWKLRSYILHCCLHCTRNVVIKTKCCLHSIVSRPGRRH